MDGGARSDRFRAAQIRTLYRGMPTGVVAAGVAASTVGLVLHLQSGIAWRPLALWVGCVAAGMSAHLAMCLLFARARPPDAAWRRWAAPFVAVTLVEGIAWGAGAIWMAGLDLGPAQFVLLILALAGVLGGAVPVLGPYLPALYAFVLPITVPYAVWAATRPDLLQRTVTFYFINYTFVVLLSAHGGFGRALKETLRLRFENLDLLDGLRVARDRAEQANLDKSRFLAAASHDLRQPVHALGMFVAALRARTLDDRARALVAHIEGSVTALEGLFDALLDISQLDAGAVAPRVEAFPVQAMLDRVGAEYAPQAAAKGLALRVAPCSAWVRTDPVLLERIVRNLVDNAVRHTARGRIVVGCRRAAGGLSLQVLDTGPGIPEAQQELVFQEFFQLGNAARDRGQGLGLGLAIVRRLSRLLGCEVSLRSAAGRGTAISVAVPLAPHEADVTRLREAASAAPDAPLSGLVLVIDDEAAIRSAMHGLLTAWGMEVVTAASGARMLDAMASLTAAPRLIVCDCWLPDGESGLDVIERLRAEFNEDVPAALVTGDVRAAPPPDGPGGVTLLHKPVPPARLRALIEGLTPAARSSSEARSAPPSRPAG